MDLKAIFNILLLSLSLATVLITLVSFILYKLRQLAVRGQFKDPIKMEGTFFVRYAPSLTKINDVARKNSTQTQKKESFGVSVGALFVIATSVVATSLFAEIYFVELQERRNKISIVDNYRKLVDQGLLKRYDFNPNPIDTNLTSLEDSSSAAEILGLKEPLRSSQIYLAITKHETSTEKRAVKKWKLFFLKQNVQIKIGLIQNASPSSTIILPSPETMTRSEKNFIEAHINHGGGLLLTGSVAIFNGAMEKTFGDWTDQILGLKFADCPDHQSFPTLFSVDQAPWWTLTPGALAEWVPDGTHYCAFMTRDSGPVAAFESNYDGYIRHLYLENQKPIVRAIFRQISKARVAWMALNPEPEITAHSIYVQNKVIFSSLSWIAGHPSAKIAAWPNGDRVAVAFGASLYKKDADVLEYLRFLKNKKLPATLFVNSQNIKDLREAVKEASVEDIDLAVSVESGDATKSSKENIVSRFDFDEIEKSRLDIEEQAAQVVLGARVSRYRFNPSTLFSLLNNRLQYVFIDDYQKGLEVVKFDGRPFILIPKYCPINKDIGTNRFPASYVLSLDEIKNTLSNDRNLGRLVTLYSENINSDSIAFINNSLSSLGDSSWSKFNFSQLQKWIFSHNNLKISLKKQDTNSKGARYRLFISNQNSTSVENVAIHLDFPLILTGNRLLQIGHLDPQSNLIVDVSEESVGIQK